MRRSCLLRASLLALALNLPVADVRAGPHDVPDGPHPIEPQGELQPHHQLHLPARPDAPRPLPEPPEDTTLREPGTIAVREVTPLIARFGTLSPQEAGFSPQVWRYLSQREALDLLGALPPVLRPEALERRIATLLQLEAEPPRRADARWFAARVQQLHHIGRHEQADALLSALPEDLRRQAEPLTLFRIYAASGKPQLACEALSGAAQPDGVQDAQWQRLDVFCHAAKGRFAEAELALALAEEAGTPYPGWFITLLEHFQYGSAPPPIQDNMGVLDRLMLEAAQPAISRRKQAPPPAELPPRRAENAPRALAQLVRGERLAEAAAWLALLDQAEGDSVRSYVAHELIRFLQQDAPAARSQAAASLPPFTGVKQASAHDLRLLERFYTVMQAFDYRVPEATTEWIAMQRASQPQDDGVSTEAQKQTQAVLRRTLDGYARSGNVAGYLLSAAPLFDTTPPGELPASMLNHLMYDLQELREQALARQLAAAALLAQME